MSYEEAFIITNYARQALLLEVSVTPKPGLVDRLNSGAHRDMDYYTFLMSSNALMKGLNSCALEGMTFKGEDRGELLKRLRAIGKDCEKEMLLATGGVNTQKGLIFSFGMILAATGKLMQEGLELFRGATSESICTEVKILTEGITKKDFQLANMKKELTHGEAIFLKYGIKGIRGEVEGGFETVRSLGLPILREADIKAFGLNKVLLQILMTYVAYNEDTNIIARGGLEGLNYARDKARSFLDQGGVYNPEYYSYLNKLNKEFISRNISPGGSADLLAVTIFFAFIEGLLK